MCIDRCQKRGSAESTGGGKDEESMGHVIAVAGKGGVGKTTLTGLLIQYLCQSGKKPVLAVDADANSNLNEVLGVEPGITLGELREEIERAGLSLIHI